MSIGSAIARGTRPPGPAFLGWEKDGRSCRLVSHTTCWCLRTPIWSPFVATSLVLLAPCTLCNDGTTLALCSWAVVNANSATIIAGGPLQGLAQTVPRAELTAALVAVSWAFQHSVSVVIWADAQYVISGARSLQDGRFCWEGCEHHDLWSQLASVLQALPRESVLFQHVHSHIQVELCESPAEEWLSSWNGFADTLAGLQNQNRPWSFVRLHEEALRYRGDMQSVVRTLRQMYDAIGGQDQEQQIRRRGEFEEPLTNAPVQQVSEERTIFLSDLLPVAWMAGIDAGDTPLPGDFLREFMQFLLAQDECADKAHRVSFLELTVMLLCSGVVFPVVGTGLTRWVSPLASCAASCTTFSVQLRAARQAAHWAIGRYGLESVVCHRLDVTSLGCTIPFDGFVMGCDVVLLGKSHGILREFTARRLIKTAAGFARPLAI